MMGGRQAGAHRPGQQGLQVPGRGLERRAEGVRGERGEGRTRKGGSRETLGKLSCVQSALLQRYVITSRRMRPTLYERQGGYRRQGGSGLRGCRTPGLGDSLPLSAHTCP